MGSVKGMSIIWDKTAGSFTAVSHMLLQGVAASPGSWAPDWLGVRKGINDIQEPALASSSPVLLSWLCRVTALSPKGVGLGSSFSHCAVSGADGIAGPTLPWVWHRSVWAEGGWIYRCMHIRLSSAASCISTENSGRNLAKVL